MLTRLATGCLIVAGSEAPDPDSEAAIAAGIAGPFPHVGLPELSSVADGPLTRFLAAMAARRADPLTQRVGPHLGSNGAGTYLTTPPFPQP